MNPILASAESSAVIATIRESKQVNPWVYNEAERLTTPHSLQLLNVPVSSGSVAASRTFTIELPKNGQLQQVWLKCTMPAFALAANDDTAIAETAENPPATANTEGFGRLGLLAMIDEIRLESSGRVHEQLSTFQILQRLSDLPLAQRTAAQKSYRMGADPPAGAAYTASLLLPFFWYKDGPRYGIDTDFQEPMRIVVKLNACTTIFDLSSTGYVAHVPSGCEAICEYRQWDDATKQQVISSNYGGGMLSRVVRLSAEEALNTHESPAAGDATATIDLKESDVVTGFYVVVECPDTGSVATYANAIKQGSPLECTNFELKFAGQSVLNVPGEFLQYYGRDYGRPAGHGAADNGVVDRDNNSNMQYVYKISFDAMGTALGNAVALREISRAQLIVTYKPAAVSTLHNIHIGYEKVSFLTVASSTGRTNLSISS
jgi:hypothetical protein